jgi:hypothetical protein
MDKIYELSNVILLLIRTGTVFRVAVIFFQMNANEDEAQTGKKRIKNTLKFYVIAELVFVLKALIMQYY